MTEDWRKLAYNTFNTINDNNIAKCHATVTILDKEFPDSYWSVFATIQGNDDKDDHVCVMSNIGREAGDRGWEDEQIWKDIPGLVATGTNQATRDDLGSGHQPVNTLWTLYIWKALKSQSMEIGKPEEAEKTKISQIIESLKEKQKKEKLRSVGKTWSCERWKDELTQQMNESQELKKGRHLVVGRLTYRYSQYHSCFSTNVGVFVYVCFAKT